MVRDLEQFYRDHRQGLYSLALTVTGSPQFAEDAVHDAFARLCEVDLIRPDNLRCYVYAAVRNAAIDAGRRTTSQKQTIESIFNGYIPRAAAVDGPADDVLTAERDQVLRQAVEALPREDREVVLLKTFAGLTFEEIGQVVEAPMKTVASRYRRALGKLEKQLRDQL